MTKINRDSAPQWTWAHSRAPQSVEPDSTNSLSARSLESSPSFRRRDPLCGDCCTRPAMEAPARPGPSLPNRAPEWPTTSSGIDSPRRNRKWLNRLAARNGGFQIILIEARHTPTAISNVGRVARIASPELGYADAMLKGRVSSGRGRLNGLAGTCNSWAPMVEHPMVVSWANADCDYLSSPPARSRGAFFLSALSAARARRCALRCSRSAGEVLLCPKAALRGP